MNKVIKNIVVAATACVLGFASASAQPIIKAGAEAVAKTSARVGVVTRVTENITHNTVAALGATAAVKAAHQLTVMPQVAPVPTSQIVSPATVKKVAPIQTTSLVQPAQITRAVAKAERENAEKIRKHQITDILLYSKELLDAFHLTDDFLDAFYVRRVMPYLSHPTYAPTTYRKGVLYRGMLVTPDELAAILHDGFSPKTSIWNSGTKGKESAVSLSSSEPEAMHYIFQSGFKKDGIGVVFVVRQKPTMELGTDPELNSTKTIYYSYEDIPAEDIVDVELFRENYVSISLKKALEQAREGTLGTNASWINQFQFGRLR